MWALRRPVLAHCATNIRCERRAMARVSQSVSGTVSTVISAKRPEMLTIIASTATTVRTALSSWPTVIETEAWMLSTSLVSRLSNSPRWRESKYANGRRFTLSSTSARSAATVRWTMTFSSRAWIQISSAAGYRASTQDSGCAQRRRSQLLVRVRHP